MKVKFRRVMFNLSCMAGILESRFLEAKRKIGGRIHPQLNICFGPIVNKYHEGHVKRTLKRKLKVLDVAANKANGSEHVSKIVSYRHMAPPRAQGGALHSSLSSSSSPRRSSPLIRRLLLEPKEEHSTPPQAPLKPKEEHSIFLQLLLKPKEGHSTPP